MIGVRLGSAASCVAMPGDCIVGRPDQEAGS